MENRFKIGDIFIARKDSCQRGRVVELISRNYGGSYFLKILQGNPGYGKSYWESEYGSAYKHVTSLMNDEDTYIKWPIESFELYRKYIADTNISRELYKGKILEEREGEILVVPDFSLTNT